MRQIKSRDTKPEMAVRRLVHHLGYRYRLHRCDLPGNPDLVFPGRRKIVFVHGCFWHQHSNAECRHGRPPRSNEGYWNQKLAKNVARDERTFRALTELGWEVLTVWECEIADPDTLAINLTNFLNSPIAQS
jgi:DNA mismatch endonuclease (patch repair protein)